MYGYRVVLYNLNLNTSLLSLVQITPPIGAVIFSSTKLTVNRRKVPALVGAVKLRFGQISSYWPFHKTTVILVCILVKDDDASSILVKDG